MSLDLELQTDLHEAFRLLYDDDEDFDGSSADEEAEADTSSINDIGQPIESPGLSSIKYSKKRLQDMLEALIPSDPSSQPSQKRRRLLPDSSDDVDSAASNSNSPNLTFSPTSLTSYRNRLLSYTLPTYNSKPIQLQPQNVARYGWRNQGRERIQCDTCAAAWFIKGFDDPRLNRNPKLRTRMADMFEEQLTKAHKRTCPWRVRQSPATIHRQLLAFHPLLSSRLAPLARELEEDYVHSTGKPTAHGEARVEAALEISHGLPQSELSNLVANLRSVSPNDSSGNTMAHLDSSPIGPEAANLAFFGWQPYRPAASGSGESSKLVKSPIPGVLQCSICDRKLGLSHFRLPNRTDSPHEANHTKGKGKVLDVVSEHREFCPIRVYAAPTSDSIEEVAMAQQHPPDAENPWWHSAIILRSKAKMEEGRHGVISESREDDRLEKKEVLSRLRAILGEKHSRLDPRKHIRSVI